MLFIPNSYIVEQSMYNVNSENRLTVNYIFLSYIM